MKFVHISGLRGWALILVGAVVFIGAGFATGRWLFPGATGGEAAQADAAGESDIWYTCGMHPQVLQREPGLCPICQMKLTPIKKGAEPQAAASAGPEERRILYWRSSMDPNYVSDRFGKDAMGMDLVPVYAEQGQTVSGKGLQIDPVVVQNMGLRTERVRRGPLVKIIRTVGRVEYDEQKVVFVDTKFMGWVERLYVDQTGQQVKKGDALFSVYSPELYSAQVEYISALRRLKALGASAPQAAAEDAQAMVEAGRRKLGYFDVSDDQIELLAKTLEPVKSLEIRSPADGVVTEKMALQGRQTGPGMRQYTIADLARVWVYADIYEYQLPWLRIGQDAVMTLPYVPGKVFRGKVVYIYPYLQQETRVIKARLEFDNPTLELKPGMFANVLLESRLREDSILIPRAAYIDSGKRKVAFVDRGGGKFEPRDLQVGVESEEGNVEVLFGLDEGDIVVTSGQFLLDTESKLKEALAKMTEPLRAGVPKREGQPAAPTIPSDAAYACPMDKHPDEADPVNQGAYFSSQPGECPRCGMKLKPLDELAWVQVMKAVGGGVVAYTCPQHEHVFSDGPGQCPRCRRELESFAAMYTCRKPQHASVVSLQLDDCPRCGEPLVAYRGRWLAKSMASLNEPPNTDVAARPRAEAEQQRPIPADAKYVCPMQECGYFSATEGDCPKCGMAIKPIDQVEWAAKLPRQAAVAVEFTCPMHPDQVHESKPGGCPICAMQLVRRDTIIGLESGPAQIQQQVDFLMEHYIALQALLASDKTADVARNALGVVHATEVLVKALESTASKPEKNSIEAVKQAHAAGLGMTGAELARDRVHFSKLSTAMRAILQHTRPDRQRWPKLYVYHCPMSKADWIQAAEKKANPYYGFKMLDCGELVETK